MEDIVNLLYSIKFVYKCSNFIKRQDLTMYPLLNAKFTIPLSQSLLK